MKLSTTRPTKATSDIGKLKLARRFIRANIMMTSTITAKPEENMTMILVQV